MELDITGARIFFTLPIDVPFLGPLRISETMVISWLVMILITGLCIWLTHDLKEENISKRSNTQRRQTRSWAFYQLEQLFTYKAKEIGADVIKVSPAYTSQRCPKCGRIHKESRHREIHEYICDVCGYRSNDDRVGAMNLFELGLRYVSGDRYPSFKIEEH